MDSEAVTFLAKAFNDLELLDLSGTLLKVKTVSVHYRNFCFKVYFPFQECDCSMFLNRGFTLFKESPNIKQNGRFETLGWAKDLIPQWEQFSSHKPYPTLKFCMNFVNHYKRQIIFIPFFIDGNPKNSIRKKVPPVISTSLVLVKTSSPLCPIVESNRNKNTVKQFGELCFDNELLSNYL